MENNSKNCLLDLMMRSVSMSFVYFLHCFCIRTIEKCIKMYLPFAICVNTGNTPQNRTIKIRLSIDCVFFFFFRSILLAFDCNACDIWTKLNYKLIRISFRIRDDKLGSLINRSASNVQFGFVDGISIIVTTRALEKQTRNTSVATIRFVIDCHTIRFIAQWFWR